ncbi:MAG: hypothetical protein E6Q97_22760 [Desulfurellales bacterium]|nr:MAG: hypothetical protein E6Q97_22760 [Desulfurellales bacterium]
MAQWLFDKDTRGIRWFDETAEPLGWVDAELDEAGEAPPASEELSILIAGYHEYRPVEVEDSQVHQIYEESSAPVDVEVIVTVYDPSLPEGAVFADSVFYVQIEDAPEQPAVIELQLDDPSWDRPTEESIISIVLDEAPAEPQEVTIIQSGYYDFRPDEVVDSEVGYTFEDAEAPVETDVPESYVTSLEEEIGLLESYLGLLVEEAEVPDEGSTQAIVAEIAELLAIEESFVPTDPIEDAPPELEVIYQVVTDEFEVRYDADPTEITYYVEDAPPVTNVMRVWIGRGTVTGTGTRVFIKG